DHDAALVAVEVQERRGEAAALWADAPAHRVALGRFDFDHVGAQVAEQLSTERPRNDGGQIKNASTNQRVISHDKNPSSAALGVRDTNCTSAASHAARSPMRL